MEYRLIVAGGRDFFKFKSVETEIDKIREHRHPNIIIVTGMARGADLMGLRYAQERGLVYERYPADWARYGKRAGFIRNKAMADHSDMLLAFWDGESKGTRNMIKTMLKQGKPVKTVRYTKVKE